jgi:Flavodoxin domain
MRALIVYESIYGNTHTVANHIASGLGREFEVDVVSVEAATAARVAAADLLVVGGPTHVHTMSSTRSRQSGRDAAHEPGKDVHLDPDAEGEGLRDWFHVLPATAPRAAAAFDTRTDAPALLTGRASRGIARRLVELGYHLAAHPESFVVDSSNRLVAGEADRAEAWAQSLSSYAPARP